MDRDRLHIAYDRSFGYVGLGMGYISYALDGIDASQEGFINWQ